MSSMAEALANVDVPLKTIFNVYVNAKIEAPRIESQLGIDFMMLSNIYAK